MTVTDNTAVDFQAQFDGRTAREVFSDLAVGTKLINRTGYSVYVFLGNRWVDATNSYAPYVVDTRYFAFTVHSSEEMLDGPWEAMGYHVMTTLNPLDGEEVSWCLGEEVARGFRRLYDAQMSKAQAEKEASEANSKVWQLELDWAMLNKKINAYADETDMCYDYERRLELWNNDFRVAKLEGRVKEWQVGVKIPALSDDTFYVEVEATSPSKANELVSEMSVEELLENAYKAGNLHSWRCGSNAAIITNPAE